MMSVTESQDQVRVLLVEDDPADAALLAECAESLKDADYSLTVARTLREALTLLDSDAFDTILLDLRLPDAQGPGLVKELRLSAADTPVVVLTGQEDEALAQRCVEAGAQDYLAKSELRPVTLRRAISFAIARAREVRLRAMQKVAGRYLALSTEGSTTSVTSRLSAAGSIRDRAPAEFVVLSEQYFDVLRQYVRQLLHREEKPSREMAVLITALGNLQAGPRDLVDLHLGALHRAVSTATEAHARAYTIDGRLLALEMMGLLVDYYRVGVRRSALGRT